MLDLQSPVSRVSVALPLLAAFAVATASAQQPMTALTPDWTVNWCGPVWPPLGFYVDTVSEDARYITLEDSTIWEVQPTDRAGVGGWTRDNFVQVRRIAAPNGDYEWLFINVTQQDWRAAVRLAGRVRPKR